MKVAIIGAGFTGLAAAYRLIKKGHKVTVIEKTSLPGGLAVGYKEKAWDWTLEAFYHHWFTNDLTILSLAKELNYPVHIKRPITSHFVEDQIYQMDSPGTLLKFPKLSLAERIQMGAALAFLRYNPLWQPLEKFTAASFLSKTIGTKAYKLLWEPLLIGKFGKYADSISLAWFWARIAKRTTNLAYPEGGFLRFAEKLTSEVEKYGGQILYNTQITQLASGKKPLIKFANGKSESYDKVIVTLPSSIFSKLAPSLPSDYKKSLERSRGLGAISLILRLKKPFFTDKTYWLSICDANSSVLAVVEHTNLISKEHYSNEHILYLGNYLAPGHKYFSLTEKELLFEFDPLLKKINPDYHKSLIGIKKFSVPFAQPIIPVNYSRLVLPFTTPLKNVYLANMEQVYPWDRGTNYAVELGDKVAKLVSS